ncbi:MAG: hypothetical protein ACE5G8_18060, partial [Anaerolineae bacterium]
MSTNAGQEAKEKAAQLCREGLENYRHWNIERAIEALEAATTLDSTQADYFLYLAQAYMRLSDYEAMRRALGRFIHLESDQTLVDRFEAFFGSAMDRVETCLTHVMAGHDIPLAVIGAAIQMWLEFRLATGRAPIDLDGAQADVWAAALDYTVRKVNI